MKLSVILLLLFISADLLGQVRPRPRDRKTNSLMEQKTVQPDPQSAELQTALRRIEKELIEGDVANLSRDFSEQVTMQLSGETGTYSSSQATALLQNYFSVRKPISFSFSRTNATAPIIFATGRLHFTHKGSQESVQIYISFAHVEGRWAIVQFNMY